MGRYATSVVCLLLAVSFTFYPLFASQQDFDDFLVNDDTTGGCGQSYPAIAKDSLGNTLVVWADSRSTNDDIFVQRYDPFGTPLGNNFKVNNPPPIYDGNPAIHPAVAANNNGIFVVVWTDQYDIESICGQIYDASGVPVGANFELGNPEKDIGFGYADVAIDENGHIYVTWLDERIAYPGENVFAQRVDPAGVPIGSDFKVNDDVSGVGRSAPAIACDGSGNFIITWSDSRDGSSEAYLQRYTSAGVSIGPNVVVNDSTSASQKTPDIAMDIDGNFTVTWEDSRNGNFDIYARRFDSTGAPIGTDFMVSNAPETAFQYIPSIDMSDSDDFVICWRDNRDDFFYDIYAQRYDSLGTAVGPNLKVNDDPGTAFQLHSSVSIDNRGNCTIAWRDSRNGETDIYAQNYDDVGLPEGSNYEVNNDTGTTDQQYSEAAICGSGNLIITWQDERSLTKDIYVQLYDAMGAPLGTNLKVNDDPGDARQHHPSVDSDSSGNFVIVWGDERNVADRKDVYAQLYDASGMPMGSNFPVNDFSVHGTLGMPSVARNRSGQFVVAWTDSRNGLSDIYAQMFDSSGNPVGSNFNVIDETQNKTQQFCDVAIDRAGNFVVVWEDYRNDDVYNSDIYSQRFDSDGNPLGSNYKVNDDSSAHFKYNPVVAMNDSGNFVITWRNTTSDIYAQRYDTSGTPIGSNLVIASGFGIRNHLAITFNNANTFTVAWQENCKNNECWSVADVFAQIFYFTGDSINSLFFIPDPAYEFYNQASPHIIASNDYLYFVWQDNRRYKGWDIYASLYDLSTLVPTFLRNYSANFSNGTIHVEWTVLSTEIEPCFEIFREHKGDGAWRRLDNVQLGRNGDHYKYVDRDIIPGESYRYMVQVNDPPGQQTLFVTDVIHTSLSLKLAVYSFPNPFNPTTNIQYTIPECSYVTLEVFDIRGRKIVSLVDRLLKSGRHNTRWEGLNSSNNPVSSGVYFLRLTAGKRTISTKIILLR
jgi:hypothetical protein